MREIFILNSHKLFLDVWHSIKPMSYLHNHLMKKGSKTRNSHVLAQTCSNCNPPVHKRQLSLIAFFLCPVARSQCSQYGQYPNCPAGTGKGKSIQVKYTITYSSCLQFGTGCEYIIDWYYVSCILHSCSSKSSRTLATPMLWVWLAGNAWTDKIREYLQCSVDRFE